MKLLDVFPELPPVDSGRRVFTLDDERRNKFFLSAYGHIVNYDSYCAVADMKTRDGVIEGLYTWFHS